MLEDTYKTIAKPSPEVLFKDRKSKFHGYAFPIANEEEVKRILEQLKKKHLSANHFCYAWQLGNETRRYRANDDGEPKNSAGMPIYRQLQSFDLTNILVVVIRIFGGAKLGVSGLINAYRTAAKMALEQSKIKVCTVETTISLEFDYAIMSEVMRIIKRHDATILAQKMEKHCNLTISIARNSSSTILDALNQIHQLKIKIV